MRRETDKGKKATESDQTSLMINEEKHIGEISLEISLEKKKLKHFFTKNTNKQAKKHQQ